MVRMTGEPSIQSMKLMAECLTSGATNDQSNARTQQECDRRDVVLT